MCCDYTKSERKALGGSGDKKAIDLIVQFLKDRDIDIVHISFDAIAQLDVNVLMEWYEVYTVNQEYRSSFLGVIAKHATKGDAIINQIQLEDIVQLLENESDENSQIAEMKILYLVSSKELNNLEYFDDNKRNELVKTALDCLAYIARHDDKWQVRAEAEHTKEELIKLRDDIF